MLQMYWRFVKKTNKVSSYIHVFGLGEGQLGSKILLDVEIKFSFNNFGSIKFCQPAKLNAKIFLIKFC